MSEEGTTEAVEAEGQGQKSAFTQEDVDRIVAERLKRERDKIGDVKALKAAADELAQIKEAQKSAAEKQAEKIAALEAEARQARVEALRFRVASKFGIADEDAELFLTGDDEETLTKQAKRLADRESERKNKNNVVPREGNNPKSAGGDERAFVRQLFGGAS